MERSKSASFVTALVIGVAAVALILTQAVEIIDAGEIGVKLRLGKVSKEELYPGIHIVIPGIERVVVFSTRVEKIDMTYKARNPITALSVEGLPVRLDVTVLYRIIPERRMKFTKTTELTLLIKLLYR